MISEDLAEPLRRFPIFQTSDAEEFRHAILTQFGAVNAEVKNHTGFKARGNLVQLHDIAVVHGASSTSVCIDYPEMEHFRFSTALTGRGEAIVDGKTTTINERQSCIISPEHHTQIRGEGSHGWLTLRLKASALEQNLISVLGYKPKGNLQFQADVQNDRPEVRSLRQLIGFLALQLDSNAAGFPLLALRSLEQAIMVTFLCATRHTFSDLFERDPEGIAPRETRLAEEYIEANWNKPIRIEDLVAVAGVSARSLFKSFHVNRGYSPMAFAKLVRLKHAKEMLTEADPNTSVTGVAFKCGFGNPGHFSKGYRDTFGELPSETLARTRRSTG